MSAEYASRMDALQRQREELTAQRQAIEKRIALREATAAEFSAVALQSSKQRLKSQRAASQAARKRNDEFVRALHATQKQTHEATLRYRGDLSSATALLAQEKARYHRKIEQVYPAWQEQLQRLRVQKLRLLEDKKRAVERRRYLAKKTFEKEKTLDDLIRQTRHEIEMSENLEQNELYERELLRTQSTTQANEINHSIREHAEEARSYLREQVTEQMEVIPELDEEIAEKLYEAFSPRSAVRALQEGNRSISFEGGQCYQEEKKPARQIRVEIPTRMNTAASSSRTRDNQRGPYHAYSPANASEDAREERYNADWESFSPTHSPVHHLVESAGLRRDYEELNSQAPSTQRDVVPDNGMDIRNGTELRGPTPVLKRAHLTASQYLELLPEYSAKSEPSAYNQPAQVLHKDATELANPQALKVGNLPSIPEIDTHRQEPSHPLGTKIASGRAADKDSETRSQAEIQHAVNAPGIVDAVALSSWRNPTTPLVISTPAKQEERRFGSSTSAGITHTFPLESAPDARSLLDEEKIGIPEPAAQTNQQALTPEASTTSSHLPDTPSAHSTMIQEKTLPVPDNMDLPNELSNDKDPALSYDAQNAAGNSGDVLPGGGGPGVDETAFNSPRIDSTLLPEVPAEIKRDHSSESNGSNGENHEELHEVESPTVHTPNTNGSLDANTTPKGSIDTDAVGLFDQGLSKQGNERQVPREDGANFISSANDTKTANQAPVLATSASASASSLEPAAEMSAFDSTQMSSGGTAIDLMLSPISTPSSLDVKTGIDKESPPSMASNSAPTQTNPESMALKSMDSDDFNLLTNEIPDTGDLAAPITTDRASTVNLEPPPTETFPSIAGPPADEAAKRSPTERLSPADQVKALGALIARIEEGAAEGDTFSGPSETGSSHESKRELVKMAVSGRKAQIAFFGSDICFELLLDIASDLGPTLFPPKAFEGIMNDQKICKLHQHNKGKELELWKLLSAHLKQLVHVKAIAPADAVDAFVAAFLTHDPENQRSRRKLREFIAALCGSKSSSPRKESSTPSPSPSSPKQDKSTPSHEPTKKQESDGRIGTPSLLQTAFLQRQSPPKQPKTFGIASSSFKASSSGSTDVLLSMGSTPTRLSHKLMRGGKMDDYSEFEEEEEVDLQNLIGTKQAFGAGSAAGRQSKAGKAVPRANKLAAAQDAEDDDDFDVDF